MPQFSLSGRFVFAIVRKKRPTDMTQREGRILRQGNTNPKVKIFRYITEGSFDAYSWQLLETKQKFIAGLLSGSLAERSEEDIENTVLSYAEVKALAVGNPLVKERVETANELSRYMTLQRKFVESRLRMEKELMELPGQISNQERNILACKSDIVFCTRWEESNPTALNAKSKRIEAEKRKLLREHIYNAVIQNVFERREKFLMKYRGFELILPANMTREKPYIWLKREGRYYLELSDTDIGNLIRIDNYLDNLQGQLEKFQAGLAKLHEREENLKSGLSVDESFSDLIEKYRQKLMAIDERLGVKK